MPSAGGPIVCAFGELSARLGLDNPAASTTETVALPALDLRPGAAASKSRLNAAACAGMVNIDEIEAAAPHLPPAILKEYPDWRDNLMFAIADALRLAPQHSKRLWAVYDATNRRGAPGKDDTYFTKADDILVKAIASPRDGQKKIIPHWRIMQVAAEHGWDGLTAAHRAANSNAPATTAFSGTTDTSLFWSQVPSDAADLHEQAWVIPRVALRGAVTMIVGPGGVLKTTLIASVGIDAAAGRRYSGPWQIKSPDEGLRVAGIFAEESGNQLGLMTNARMQAEAFNPRERANVKRNWVYHDAAKSGLLFGASRPGSSLPVPEGEDRWLNQLRAALIGVDILFIDNFAAVFCVPSENDNQAVTSALRRVAKVAAETGTGVVLIHHSPKQSRQTTAELAGDVLASRGGSAFGNTSRAMLTVTYPTVAEAAQLAMLGHNPDLVRKVQHAKINDMRPMDPAFFIVVTELVKTRDGDVEVRTIQWLAMPTAANRINPATYNAVMQAVDLGTHNAHGARVPLSPGGGRSNERDASAAIVRALVNANPTLTEPQAKGVAREVLKDLIARGCITSSEVTIPRYKPSGQLDGSRSAKGLVTNWSLAPWIPSPAATTPAAAVPQTDGAEVPATPQQEGETVTTNQGASP